MAEPKKEVRIEEVRITDQDGRVLTEKETKELLRKLQRGVFYLPQKR